MTGTNTPTPTATATSGVDPDGDGISASEENGVPNPSGTGTGDGNGDGIPDAEQPHVTSFRNGENGSYLTLAAPQGIPITAVIVGPAPTGQPVGLHLPQGLINFQLNGVPVGGSISTTLHIQAGEDPSGYWKFGPTADNPTPHWYAFAFDGATGAILTGEHTLTLQFVDGGRGDGDLTENGVIVDPGGPGRLSSFPLWLPLVER